MRLDISKVLGVMAAVETETIGLFMLLIERAKQAPNTNVFVRDALKRALELDRPEECTVEYEVLQRKER